MKFTLFIFQAKSSAKKFLTQFFINNLKINSKKTRLSIKMIIYCIYISSKQKKYSDFQNDILLYEYHAENGTKI